MPYFLYSGQHVTVESGPAANVVNNLLPCTEFRCAFAGWCCKCNKFGRKVKAYLLGAKYTDTWATFDEKDLHIAARGFDFTDKASVMLKKYKSVPESKKNDVLIADALALKLNMLISSTTM